MGVAGACRKADAEAGAQRLDASVGLQFDLALHDIDEFVLSRMGVAAGGLTARNDPGQVDAEICQAGVIAEAAIPSLL